VDLRVVGQQLWKPSIQNRQSCTTAADLPYNAPELISKLRNANVNFDAHPVRNDGAIWGYLKSNFPILLIGGLFSSFVALVTFRGLQAKPLNFGKSRRLPNGSQNRDQV